MTEGAPPPQGGSGPVFLAGADRTGIGLLAELLDAHPAFAISRRTNFWAFYDGRFGDLAAHRNLDRCIDAIMSYRRIRDLGVDRTRLRSDFLRGEPSYTNLFELIGLQHAERRGKRRWGDKSLNTEHDASRILTGYPTARMIQVVRDPRDRYASLRDHRGNTRAGASGAAAVWTASMARARANLEGFHDRYLVIRYEDLVTQPVEQLELVCRFVGEDFGQELFQGFRSTVASIEVQGQFTTLSIGRYVRDLTARQVAVFEYLLGADMREWGYPVGRAALRAGIVEDVFQRILVPLWMWRWHRKRRGAEPSVRRTIE